MRQRTCPTSSGMPPRLLNLLAAATLRDRLTDAVDVGEVFAGFVHGKSCIRFFIRGQNPLTAVPGKPVVDEGCLTLQTISVPRRPGGAVIVGCLTQAHLLADAVTEIAGDDAVEDDLVH